MDNITEEKLKDNIIVGAYQILWFIINISEPIRPKCFQKQTSSFQNIE